ncbi:MAG TPA: flagellar motor protein MotB [Bryobacteraceae bacterium]
MPKPPSPPDRHPQPVRRPARRAHTRRIHAGAWKVAYADFVTALMALFIVLWMMNASKAVKASVSGYFRDPRAYTARLGAGPAGAGEGMPVGRGTVDNLQQQIENALRKMPDFGKLQGHVQFSVTGEGLRIDLMETEQGLFFVTGSAAPTREGEELLRILAAQIGSMPNRLVIEGHTDARPFRNDTLLAGYGNWELATDRANAARRLLYSYGLRQDQVAEVRGFADQRLLNPADPNDPKNRRVSLVVKFQ